MLIQCAHTKDCIKEAGSQCPMGYELQNHGTEHQRSYSTGSQGDPSILWDLDVEMPAETTSVMVKCRPRSHRVAEADRGEKRPDEGEQPGPGKRPPPLGAAGFELGETTAEVERKCRAAGHEWDTSPKRPTCSGPAKPVGLPVTTRFKFCDGALCVLELRLAPGEHGAGLSWKHTIAQLNNTLEVRYGRASQERVHLPPACRSHLDDCLATGTAWTKSRWTWQDGHRIALFTQASADPPAISVKYIRPADAPIAAAL
jgi:hypothetical protein